MVSIRNSAVKRAVFVTGASSGIGKACALHLDRLGFAVFAGVRKDADGAGLVAEAPGIRPVIVDVTKSDTIAAAVAEVRIEVGESGLYGLVNNAGIAVVGPIETLTASDIREQFDVNVVGQLAVTQAFLPLVRQARGRIVIMGSIFGLLSCPFVGVYAASKFALEALADALRVELAPWEIEVSLIEPGRMATTIWGKSFVAMEKMQTREDEVHALYAASMTLARKKAEEFARTCTSPQRVARAVAHALTARRPKTRYKVGRDVRFWAPLRRHAPDRLADWVINLMLRMGA
ncbi:MAG: SDR family oxidoreductase [Candidatus Hydrogenedentes bacterium]|nr:SDR family oxidoreductase [Candidatus Hydrogenedentota bacterium]